MEYEMAIESIHCDRCATNIERYLRNQPGIDTVEVDGQSGTARFEADLDVDVTRVIGTIDSMGYGPARLDPAGSDHA